MLITYPRSSIPLVAFSATQGIISALFSQGQQGALLVPQPTVDGVQVLFQDAAGTAPVVDDGDPVGLMLDLHKGLKLGPELIVNTDASSGLSPWTESGATVDTSNDVFSITASSNFGYMQQDQQLSAGALLIEFDVVSVSSTNQAIVNIYPAGSSVSNPRIDGLRFSEGHHSIIAVQDGLSRIRLRVQDAGETVVFDNISVRELPGNHATQSVSADRPIYHTDGTLHWLSFNGTNSYLANADLTLGTLPFTIAAALKTSSSGSPSAIFSLGDAATSGALWRITSELGVRTSGGNELYDQTPTVTAPDVLTSTFPGGGVSVTNASMYKNGTELGVLSSAEQSIDLAAGLGVFADADGGVILPGDFFGAVVTSEVLPLARRARLENYLANLAGVSL